jgi:T5SS/PEP-CTERM-associated repeat protein
MLGLAVCGAAATARATDVTWITSGGGSFGDEANWVPDLPFSSDVPGTNDIAHFGLTTSSVGSPVTYTVTFAADHTNQRLVAEDDRVTFDLNSHTYTVTNPTAVVLGTESGRLGRLAVMDGLLSTAFRADIEIGSVAGSSGTLQVLNDGLVLGSPEIFVGASGGGTLSIFNNGDVIAGDTTVGWNSGATGTATITNAGSSLLADVLVVGSSGTGVLNVTASGRVDSASGVVGDLLGSTGTANVDGALSRWINTGALIVGDAGSGTLNITASGRVDSASGVIGSQADITGTVNVDGAGSEWNNTGTLTVGRAGTGRLHITAGGKVQSLIGQIGETADINSIVTVSGADSQWNNSSSLTVGHFVAQGSLDVTDGGSVSSTDGFLGVHDQRRWRVQFRLDLRHAPCRNF